MEQQRWAARWADGCHIAFRKGLNGCTVCCLPMCGEKRTSCYFGFGVICMDARDGLHGVLDAFRYAVGHGVMNAFGS